MNLKDRIKAYLEKKNDWIHVDDIYIKALQEGYTSEAIKRSLTSIASTPPYASISVYDDPNRASGMYYRWYAMTDKQMEFLRLQDEAWNEI